MITYRKFNEGYLSTHLYGHHYTDISNRVITEKMTVL